MGGLVPGYGRETRDNRYWCLAMFCPSVSAIFLHSWGVLSTNSESQAVSAKSCFVDIAVCMWHLGAFTCSCHRPGPRWALPLSVFKGLTSMTQLPLRCHLWILAKVCPQVFPPLNSSPQPSPRGPLGLWAVEGISHPVRGHGLRCRAPAPLAFAHSALSGQGHHRDLLLRWHYFQTLYGPQCVRFFSTCSRASSRELPMHLPPLTDEKSLHGPRSPLTWEGLLELQTYIRLLASQGGKGVHWTEQPVKQALPCLPRAHGTPGRAPPEGSAHALFPSAHLPSSASFPCGR